MSVSAAILNFDLVTAKPHTSHPSITNTGSFLCVLAFSAIGLVVPVQFPSAWA